MFGIEVRDEKQRHTIKMRSKLLFWNIPQSLSKKILTTSPGFLGLKQLMFYILKEMENKSTLQISKELGRKYDSVLAFVREVQEIAEKGKQGSLSKGSYQETIRKRRLTVYEGGIRANIDKYSVIEVKT